MTRHRVGASLRALLCGLAVLSLTAPARAAPPTFRIEVHAVQTLTLTRAQLLAGSTDGARPVTIAGELRLPFVAAPRMPAVLMLHGDAGAISNQVAWIQELNAAGIAVFTLDSFSGRGAVSTDAGLASMPDSVGGTGRVIDAERALAVLAAHPRIDPARIAVMGFSSGGRTALVAAQSRFASAFGTPGRRFAAYIALYPDCSVRLLGDTRSEPGPQRIFIGQADVLTSAGACVKYAERLRQAGADIVTETFPGAHHGFDNAGSPELNRIPGYPTSARCSYEETSPGTIVNADTGRPPAEDDACMGKGLIAGYDAAADAATRTAVRAFLLQTFAGGR